MSTSISATQQGITAASRQPILPSGSALPSNLNCKTNTLSQNRNLGSDGDSPSPRSLSSVSSPSSPQTSNDVRRVEQKRRASDMYPTTGMAATSFSGRLEVQLSSQLAACNLESARSLPTDAGWRAGVRSASSTPPVPIPHVAESSISRRPSYTNANISPAASERNFLHRYRSDTSISKSHNTGRTLKKSRHSRSLTFASDDEDDFTCSGYRNSPPSLPLIPYRNQVGGHASFLRFSDKALCKPLNMKEKQFYEVLESAHPEIKPFIATYLGVVNVTYSTANSETDGFAVAEGTPLVLLEENQHILFDDAETPNRLLKDGSDHSLNGSPGFNRRLQAQVFKDALSPQSLRARFQQLRTAAGSIARRHSFSNGELHTRDTSDTPTSAATATAPQGIADLQPEARPHLVVPESSADALSPIFQMSDDEEDKASDSRPHGRAYSPQKNFSPPPSRIARSPSTPVQPSVDDHGHRPVVGTTPAGYNPWSLHLYNNSLAKIASKKDGAAKKRTHQFLLLEDLTEGLKYPCILDLKMGSRQHGVYATPEKRLSQERKCELSTSKALGVRICGMQVYKQTTNSFTYLDKYVGRRINMSNFKPSLLSFLDNGERYMVGYIPKMLQKLRNLHDVVSTLSTYRFYASSLLIVYDGAWAEGVDDQNVPKVHPSSASGQSDDMTSVPGLLLSKRSREVTVKMIDFANCVTNTDRLIRQGELSSSPSDIAVPFPPTTRGPDNGYLLGLRTLMRNFEEIYEELGGGRSGPHLDAFGHVLKSALTMTQLVSVCGFGATAGDLLSPQPILLAGSAPVGTTGAVTSSGRVTSTSVGDVLPHATGFKVDVQYKDNPSAIRAGAKEKDPEIGK
ncbi:hypothetical protein HDU85_006221 [Gaertneriomyces sp. JEL0708]|nr:hypothetical protein HDU85_006221 [Gaertneriomyces sp. JEL0708]